VFLDAFVDPKGHPLFFGRTVCQAGARLGAGAEQVGITIILVQKCRVRICKANHKYVSEYAAN
jgi:hypothetical protein